MSFIHRTYLPAIEQAVGVFPISPEERAEKCRLEEQLKMILTGKDHRLVIIVGPCAADYEDPVMEYVYRLSVLQEAVKDSLLLIPRIYTAKPRSAFSGYTGMLYYPDPNSEQDITAGIFTARRIHLRVIKECNMLSADELLYLDLLPYLSDVVSYFAVGARSVENQMYPWVASGMDVPVGLKNPRCGEIDVLANAVITAQRTNKFSFGGSIYETTGNTAAHGIFRGYSDFSGVSHSNYGFETIHQYIEAQRNKGAVPAGVVIDCSHDNSGKRAEKQSEVCHNVLSQMSSYAEMKQAVRGFMLESYLVSGKCGSESTKAGKSLVDACLGWQETELLIRQIADLLP